MGGSALQQKTLGLFERYLSLWVAGCMVIGASIRSVGKRPRGMFVTLFVNWMVKPFSMALIAWLFFRHVFSPWIGPSDADQHIAGAIILAAAPLRWRYRSMRCCIPLRSALWYP